MSTTDNISTIDGMKMAARFRHTKVYDRQEDQQGADELDIVPTSGILTPSFSTLPQYLLPSAIMSSHTWFCTYHENTILILDSVTCLSRQIT